MNASRRACLCTAPLVLAAALAACSSPRTYYYRLMAVPGTVRDVAPISVAICNVSIPGYLDRDGIAMVGSGYQFAFFSNDLWAEQLSAMLKTVMIQELAQRLPAVTVLGSGGAIDVPSDILIEIDVLRFDPDSTGTLVLGAQIAIKSGPSRMLWTTRSFNDSIALTNGGAGSNGPDASEIAAKMSALWAAMADQVADIIVDSQTARPLAGPGAG